MEKNTLFVINLKDQKVDVTEYQWVVDDSFFQTMEASDIQHGKVDVSLSVRRTSGAFALTFRFKGMLKLPCDRCMEDMELPIEAERCLKMKLGDEYDDDGELVTIPYGEGNAVSMAWHIYEFIALEMPLRHVHPDGKCKDLEYEILSNN